jgi:hypothetical protein
MKTAPLLFAVGCIFCGTARAGEQPADPAPAAPMSAKYLIYSGDMGDERAPTKTDRKLSIQVSGQAAREIFDSIYPDSKVTCSEEKGQRLREKGELWCAFSPSNGYRCYFGFDLRTGKSIGGASC